MTFMGLNGEKPGQVGVVQGGKESELLQELRLAGVFLLERALQEQELRLAGWVALSSSWSGRFRNRRATVSRRSMWVAL